MAKVYVTLCPVVSVINMKGGVGKTLVSANVFNELFLTKKKRILLIDFDPQYNLSQLVLTKPDYDNLKDNGKTILNIVEAPKPVSVFEISGNDLLDIKDVESYTHEIGAITGHPDKQLRLLAGDVGLARLNLRERDTTMRVPRKRFEKFVSKAREIYDLVVLDCNPSTSFLTRSALEVSTHLIIPIRPDRYSMLGAQMLLEFMDYLPTIGDPPKKMLLFNGLSSAPKKAEKDTISIIRGDDNLGPMTLVTSIPQSDVLKAKPEYAGFASQSGVPYSLDIKSKLEKVADEISVKIGF